MSVLTRAILHKIGWNWISVALSLLIVAIVAVTLVQLARDIELEKVLAALCEQPIEKVLIAGGFIAASYITLTLYDFFALHTIGKTSVPYRIAALASFTSYTIGHNLGATVLTGNVIRFRIYSAWGLNVVDVAKIAFVTGLTFWLGNAAVLGSGMSFAPEAASAVNRLPSSINRAVGLTGVIAIVCYLIWLLPRPRVVGRSNWRIVLPNLRLTLVQIGIGVIDLGLEALAMYTLLPNTPEIEFITLLVIFVTAMLLGFVSHAPGSLGVIEAAMLLGLPEFQKEELIASMLMFRLLYFILPLLCAALLLGSRELWLALGSTSNQCLRNERAPDPP